VPSGLEEERQTNPFLRADDATLKAHLGLQQVPDEEVFAYIRASKDKF
jgi:hydroxyacylglutathione hydrolase